MVSGVVRHVGRRCLDVRAARQTLRPVRVRGSGDAHSPPGIPMIPACRCGLLLTAPSNDQHWLPSRDPEPGPEVQAVALCGQDPTILRSERTPGGWRSRGAAAIYPEGTPPKPWERVGRCWDGREHPVRDVTGLLHHA
jgi:hypothetical protein